MHYGVPMRKTFIKSRTRIRIKNIVSIDLFFISYYYKNIHILRIDDSIMYILKYLYVLSQVTLRWGKYINDTKNRLHRVLFVNIINNLY